MEEHWERPTAADVRDAAKWVAKTHHMTMSTPSQVDRLLADLAADERTKLLESYAAALMASMHYARPGGSRGGQALVGLVAMFMANGRDLGPLTSTDVAEYL